MRCTSCNEVIRPVVAVDIDGTLARYYEHFIWFAEQYVGRMLSKDFAGDEEFSEHLGMEKEEYRSVKLAYRQGGMKRSMPLFSGAHRFMLDLHLLDVEIWIATTRPWLRLDNIDPDTREWLTRNKIPYNYMVYGEDKYEQLIERVGRERVVGIVDDLAEQCAAAEKAIGWSGIVIQPSRAHNARARFEPQAPNFIAVFNRIATNIERWRIENEDVGDRSSTEFDR